MGRPDAVILVTGGTNGLLEPCHCAGSMPGGHSRRIGVIREYRKAFPNIRFVDTGDAFVPDRAASLRNLHVIRGYRRMGYDALVLGDQEWAVPEYMMSDLLTAGGPAYLSTTVSSRSGKNLRLTDVVTKEWGPVKVAVVSDNHDVEFRFMPAALRAPKRTGMKYVPAEACGECHPSALATWKMSRHARAYDTLARAKRTGDPDCVKCHVTGFGTRDGFTTPEATTVLARVGCQVCHPVELAVHAGGRVAPPPVTRDRCLSCHTKVTDPKYEHALRWDHVRCDRGWERGPVTSRREDP
jgi:Cytochrome c554 and c-prime